MSNEKDVKEKPAKEKTSGQKLQEFRDFVNTITDEQLLKSAESLMSDMNQVEIMKEKIEMLESHFCEGDRVAFWFFTVGLDKDSIDIATNTVKGRIEFVKNREERAKRSKEIDEEKVADTEGMINYLTIHKDLIKKTFKLKAKEMNDLLIEDNWSLKNREDRHRVYGNSVSDGKIQVATSKLTDGKTSVAFMHNGVWQQFAPEDFCFCKNVTPNGTVFHLVSKMVSHVYQRNSLDFHPHDVFLSTLEPEIKNAICNPRDVATFAAFVLKSEAIEQAMKDKGIVQASPEFEKLFLEEVVKLNPPAVPALTNPASEIPLGV